MLAAVVGDVRTEAQGAIVQSGAVSVILGPLNLGKRPRKSFSLVNYGPSTLSGAIVQVNPDPNGYETQLFGEQIGGDPTVRMPPDPALWHTYSASAFGNLASGECRSLVSSDLFRWWRIVGVSNSGSAVVTCSGFSHASTL